MINAELFPVERRDQILDLLQSEGKVVAFDLARRLEVSIDTIRRDLDHLASTGSIRRVHGGALPAAKAPGPLKQRTEEEPGAKHELGRRGASLVRAGSVVLFDSGSTNLEIVKSLTPDLCFTAVTPCLPIAIALAELPEVEVILLGGRLHRRESMTVGLRATKEHFDLVRRGAGDETDIRPVCWRSRWATDGHQIQQSRSVCSRFHWNSYSCDCRIGSWDERTRSSATLRSIR
jgi:hypothetical protein